MLSSPQQCLLSLCLSHPLSESFHLPSGPLHHQWKMLSECQTCLHRTKKMCVSSPEGGWSGCLVLLLLQGWAGSSLSPWLSWEHPGQMILYVLQSPFGLLPAAPKPLQCPNDAGKNSKDPLLLKHHQDQSQQHFISLTYFPLWSANEAKKVQLITHLKEESH